MAGDSKGQSTRVAAVVIVVLALAASAYFARDLLTPRQRSGTLMGSAVKSDSSSRGVSDAVSKAGEQASVEVLAESVTQAVAEAGEEASIAVLAESVTQAVTEAGEEASIAVLAESAAQAVAEAGEQASVAVLAESAAQAVAEAGEQASVAVLAESAAQAVPEAGEQASVAEVAESAAQAVPEAGEQASVAVLAESVAQAVSQAGEQASVAEVAASVAQAVAAIDLKADAEAVGRTAALAASESLPEADAAQIQAAVVEAVVEKQAESYITNLTEPEALPVPAERADHFVTKEQVISLLPETLIEITTVEALLSDPDLGPDTPITVVREVEQIEIATAEKVIATARGDLSRPIRVVIDDDITEITVREILHRLVSDPDQPIAILRNVQYFEVTTPLEFAAQADLEPGEPLRIIKQPYRLEAATVAELLMEQLDLPPETVFYLRTVRESDGQGIWGIVQESLTGNFARGMAIRLGKDVGTYQVEIPEYADELLENKSSSFLGRMIHDKTLHSYVYNFKEHRMGRNPDRIYPGQEIVILHFQPEELISIFKHFIAGRG